MPVALVALALVAIFFANDIVGKLKQRAFYEVDLSQMGEAFWRGRDEVVLASPKDKIPVQLPGPSDGWAGGGEKRIVITAPFPSQNTAFTVFFLESHEVSPPYIEVWAGEKKVAGFQVAKGTGLPSIHWPREGKTSRNTFFIPGKFLAPGAQVSLRSTAGSWAALQLITARVQPPRWEYVIAATAAVLFLLLAAALAAARVAASGAGTKEIAFSSILAAMGLAAGLAMGEIALRVFDIPPRPMKPQPVRNFQLSSNPVMLYEYRPNLRHGDGDQGAPELEIATNSAGFRDKERAVEKPAGVYRVIVAGDSTTAGSGVGAEEALFTRLLEDQWNAAGKKPPLEALNMGVMGYQTLQEVETVRVNGVKYRPDLAITVFCHNDFQLFVDGSTYYNLLQSNPDFKAKGRTPGLADQLITRSRLAFVVYHRLMAAAAPPTNWDVIVNDYRDKYMGSKNLVEAGMENFSNTARANGFTAVMAILPVFDRPFDQYRHGYQHDRVREAVSKFDNVILWDLREDFAGIDNEAGKFSFDGLHMNEAGHQAMARILAERIGKLLEGGKRADGAR